MIHARGWLIKNCPNFYFMPSLWHDRAFFEWGDAGTKMSCAYFKSAGYDPVQLIDCDNQHATHWIIDGHRFAFDLESADSAISMGRHVEPLCLRGEDLPMVK